MSKQKTCQSAKLLQEICRNFARNFFAKFLKKRLENFFKCAYNPTCQKRDGFAFDGKRLLGMNRELLTMKCVVCGDEAEYVINKTVPLCEACFDTIDETDETGEITVDELQDKSQDE